MSPRDILGVIFYDIDETAAILGVSRRTVLAYIKSGDLRGFRRIGRRSYINQADLERSPILKRRTRDTRGGGEEEAR